MRFAEENITREENKASLARAKSEFLERHLLNWLPKAAEKLGKTGAPGFPLLMNLLVRFIRREGSTNG